MKGLHLTRYMHTHGWLLGVLAIASFAMLFRLGDRPIQNWDEGIHGEVSFEMVESGNWLTPQYVGGPYFRKPPLKIWLSAGLFALLPTPSNSPLRAGASEPEASQWAGEKLIAWALRLPSAAAGIATAFLVAWWMWEWRRSRLEAFLAGVIVATMRPIFFHAFRTGEMDGMLTLFVVAALYCWWRATECPTPTFSPSRWEGESKRGWVPVSRQTTWLALTGVAIGLAIMTKSAAGLLPLLIIAVDWLLRRLRIVPPRSMLVLGIWILVIVAPWHLAMTALYGMTFWNDYVGWHVVKRATEVLHNPTASAWWWYLPTFARRFTPYTYWFMPAIAYAIGWGKTAKMQGSKTATVPMVAALPHCRIAALPDQTTSLLLTWFFLGFALFTLARTKFDWYLLPLYPAAVMLTVPFLIASAQFVRDMLARRSLALGRVARVAILILVVGSGLAVTARHLLRIEPPNPFPAIAAAVRGTGGHLVSYDLDYKQHPAGYFILRAALANDVRILDGRSDVARTLSMLRERERGFLLTERTAELPEELRAAIISPQMFGVFTLWTRQ